MLLSWEPASSLSACSVLHNGGDGEQFGIRVMSYTNVPQGGVLHFLMRNSMVIVVMLSNDLVIVVVPLIKEM